MLQYFHAKVEMKFQVFSKYQVVDLCISKNHIALHNYRQIYFKQVFFYGNNSFIIVIRLFSRYLFNCPIDFYPMNI